MVCTTESMSVYRLTGKGMWSSLSSFERRNLIKRLKLDGKMDGFKD